MTTSDSQVLRIQGDLKRSTDHQVIVLCYRLFFLLCIILLSIMVGALIAGCGGKDGSSSRAVTPGYGTSGSGDYGTYVAGTDRWHIHFTDSALTKGLEIVGLSPDDANDVKRKTIENLNLFFSGVSISFSTKAPDGYVAPDSGVTTNVSNLGSSPYNVIELWDAGGTENSCGRAFTDMSGFNEMVENDSGYSTILNQQMGIFMDRFAEIAEMWGSKTLEDFTRYLGIITAHEIGHSLGLRHNDDSLNIMQSSFPFDPAVKDIFFAPEDITWLKGVMPGPGRN
ncbi:MAG: matrixin family metalloprotease [Planctomycetota bacterium]|jgi:hypothetical protein